MIEKFFKITKHIPIEIFFHKINQNINYLIKNQYIKDNKSVYVFIDHAYEYLYKSNYWIYKYIQHYIITKYKSKNIQIKFYANIDYDILQENDVILFVDDCLYTGRQMEGAIGRFINPNKIKLQLILLVPYISEIALNNLSNSGIFISPHYEKIKTVNELLDNKEKIAFKKLYNNYYGYQGNPLEKYAIYFDHKLGDDVSTYPLLYSGVVPNEYNKKILLEKQKYEKEFMLGKSSFEKYPELEAKKLEFDNKLQIYPLFTHCEKFRNTNVDSPTCPPVPYKPNYKKALQKIKNK